MYIVTIIFSQFTDNMVEELNSFGIQFLKYNKNNNYKLFINLVSVMINIVKKSSSNINITEYAKCSFIDRLLIYNNINIEVTSICIKFIKQVSKIYSKYIYIYNIDLCL